MRQFVDAGVRAYLTKPLDARSLLRPWTRVSERESQECLSRLRLNLLRTSAWGGDHGSQPREPPQRRKHYPDLVSRIIWPVHMPVCVATESTEV